MGKANAGAQAPEQARNGPPPDDGGGWQEVGGDVDGWWKPTEGATIEGILLGREWHEVNGQAFYRVRIGKVCQAIPPRSAPGAAPVTMAVGKVIGVGERVRLIPLREWAGSGTAQIRIRALEQVPSKRGTVWLFKVEARGKKLPAAASAHELAAAAKGDEQAGDGEIPF